MSPSSFLLRVVLCIGLVLNGSGYAVAATQMQIEHSAKVSERTQVSAATGHDAAVPPCHEDSGMAAIAPDVSTAAIGDTGDDPSEPEPSIPDCCKSSNCAGACLQHAFTVLLGLPADTVLIDHASSVRLMRMGHPAPALPHLIRPPIS